ncbi:putative TPR repeat-containing protein [Camellia lanceoleosa]|nr:putative TPR repeat-containing protein [Camellia lanceoleosa]
MFNETAAWEYALSMVGKPYGYHNLIFSWIDTIDGNYPPPLDAHVVASVMTVWNNVQPDYATNMWNEALNKLLGTKKLKGMGSSFDELLTIPEQDNWIYSDGKSISCVIFVLEMYKEAGLFDLIANSIQVTEFTVASVMTVWNNVQPDYAANMWNEALNKRLGTKGLDLPEILVEAERRGSSFDELLTIPEQDDWIYTDGKSTSCVVFILEMYKEAGLFDPIANSIQVTEFTIKDAYTLKFFENNSSCLPKWCNDLDTVKLPFCQIRGKYRMELPGYNTMDPYPHMNERCSSLPPKNSRPKVSAALEEASSSSITDERVVELHKKQKTAAWAVSPNHGIVFDDTWKLVDDLEILIKRLKAKQAKDGKLKGYNSDVYSDPGWSRELGPSSEISDKRVFWEESRNDYALFVKELGVLRSRADGARSREEAFDGHMAIGRVLYEHQLYKEALVSFKKACELQPTDVRPHFRAGNCFYVLGRHSEAKEEFLLALEAAEASGNQWSYLLPQIHVNLGISLEGKGMVISACEHYREATMLCPTHFRALKLLGSALFGVGEYKAAVKALEEAIYLKDDYVDAHCDLASALHAMGDDDNAVKEFQKAIVEKPLLS